MRFKKCVFLEKTYEALLCQISVERPTQEKNEGGIGKGRWHVGGNE